MIGKKFGLLLVVGEAPVPAGRTSKELFYLCKCDCGTEKVAEGDRLRNGRTKSCGCFGMLPDGEASFNLLYNRYKINATDRGYNFDLSKDEFKSLTKQNCYYCNAEPSLTCKPKYANGGYLYSGVDRLDNSFGYTLDNCVPCCYTCNIAKHCMTQDEFKNWIRRIYNFYAKE